MLPYCVSDSVVLRDMRIQHLLVFSKHIFFPCLMLSQRYVVHTALMCFEVFMLRRSDVMFFRWMSGSGEFTELSGSRYDALNTF